MTGLSPGGTPAIARAQVFVDDSGRRRRWLRLFGAGTTTLCATYIGVVVFGLSQTGVGPLEAVPVGGNGEIAGFQASAGTVPGLLTVGAAPRATGQGGHATVPLRRAAPVVRDTVVRDTAVKDRAPEATKSIDTAAVVKAAAAPARPPAPIAAKPVDSKGGSSTATGTTPTGTTPTGTSPTGTTPSTTSPTTKAGRKTSGKKTAAGEAGAIASDTHGAV